MGRTAASQADKDPLSHNLLGQRLGRKGRDTRERIIAAAERLLAGPPDTVISLSAVSREANLAMTTLYLYFSDLTELLLAVLEPIMASAEESYIGKLRCYWPDEALAENCVEFVVAFHAFWTRHTRILHLRNYYAESYDERMRAHREAASRPMLQLFIEQMEGDPGAFPSQGSAMATFMLTGIERLITISTEERFLSRVETDDPDRYIDVILQAQARVLELVIRDRRAAVRERTV
jgi:AcrR family transcriptional regulator